MKQDSYPWASLNDADLLKLRFQDLKLRIEGSRIEAHTQSLLTELENKGLPFRPKFYFGDEWFSPEGIVAIAIPYYLAHPRLLQLERSIMLDAEGSDSDSFMKLIRHEAGHCFDHAYRFSKTPRWHRLFGSPDQDYTPETYRPRPYSRSFVRHLENWYAQAHPEEDFAESFAVWLTPGLDWKNTYKGWPIVLEKLHYIDEIAAEVSKKSHSKRSRTVYLTCDISRMKSTLDNFYAKKRKLHADEYPDFYDTDLRRIFDGDGGLSKREYGAARFMTKHKKDIIESVSYWTGERKFTINSLIKKLTLRCENLDLKVGKNEAHTNLEIAAYLATLITNYLFTGKFKRTV